MIQSIFSFFFFCQRLIVRTSVDQTTSVTVNNLTVLLCNNQVKAGGQCRLDLRPYFFGVTAHLNEYVHIKEVQMFLTLFLFYLCCLLFNAKPPPPKEVSLSSSGCSSPEALFIYVFTYIHVQVTHLISSRDIILLQLLP